MHSTDSIVRTAATDTKPAADVAGQASVGMAMIAKYFAVSPNATEADRADLVPRLQTNAIRAYEYASFVFARDGNFSTCQQSAALTNCIGESCDTSQFIPPCQLYFNPDPVRRFSPAMSSAQCM